MLAAALTPFLRRRRARWGAGAAAARVHPGDDLLADPRWGWTHAVEVAASPADVWPWLAQIGADRGGFYSYSRLENLVGCRLRNAQRAHPEWEAREGGSLSIHPKMPPLRIISVEPGRHVLAHGAPDEAARAAGEPWVAVTWLFQVEPLGPGRSRVVSRYRCATSPDRRSRLAYGPALLEPIGFVMDRRMLRGIKARAERRPPGFGELSRPTHLPDRGIPARPGGRAPMPGLRRRTTLGPPSTSQEVAP